MTNPKPDLFGHLHKNTPDTPKGRMLLYSEARLIIGAGRLVSLRQSYAPKEALLILNQRHNRNRVNQHFREPSSISGMASQTP